METLILGHQRLAEKKIQDCIDLFLQAINGCVLCDDTSGLSDITSRYIC